MKRVVDVGARSVLRRGVALAVAASGLAVIGTAQQAAQAAPGDRDTLSVRVVQDFNGDGGWDDPFIEPGLAGVKVQVTNEAGVTEELTTDADGLVEITTPGSYRIVAVNPEPGRLRPAPAHEKDENADIPSDKGKWLSPNEEFVTLEEGRAVELTTGFWVPGEYCQSNPLIVTACQPKMYTGSGNATPESAGDDTLVAAPYRGEGVDTGKQTLATKADTGALYGIGVRRDDGGDQTQYTIFSGAFAKRASDYGDGGPGAIYRTTPGGATEVWGTVPNAGTAQHIPNDSRNDGGREDWNFVPAVGKESLGDLDVSEWSNDLQVINLNDRQLYIYDTAQSGPMPAPKQVIDLKALPHGCAAADDWRPAALGESKDSLYVGGVCTAESSQDAADLKAIVFAFERATYTNPVKVMDQPLSAQRQFTGGGACRAVDTTYRPWNDKGLDCTRTKGGQTPDPQPWLTDIVSEIDGSLILGFRDRTGDQHLGNNSRYYGDTDVTGPDSGRENLVGEIRTNVAGDINKACADDNGMFVLDMNGACGIEPDGEFYTGDANVHTESANGGLVLSRGERGVATNYMDPWGIFSQGYASISRGTGQGLDTVGDTTSRDPDEVPGGGGGGNAFSGAAAFGKGAGIADMEVLCDFAPIQIGNRVWNDINGDGIQDPGEDGIAGVTVNLYDANGDLVASKVTNSRGEYYFDSIDDGVKFNTDYTIRLDNPDDYTGKGPLVGANLSPADQGDHDGLDSDGTPGTDGRAEYAITTGNRGDDDHTFDFGFSKPGVSVGDFVWADSDGDGLQDAGEPGIPGVVLKLVGPDGQPVTDLDGNDVGPETTNANGRYSFDRLPVLPKGQHYKVIIDQDASADALEGYLPTEAGAGENRANDSSLWEAESGDLDVDGMRDPTLDFGFIRPAVSVGDFVWVDTDKDGVQDAGEPGIEGVVLVLTGPDGQPVTDIDGKPVGPVTTDANGKYSFDNLPVLADGESYTVSIDREADSTKTALAPYVPTKEGDNEGAGADDSSTWTAKSTGLTKDGQRDATLDFGFVKPSVSVGDYVWFDGDNNGIQDNGEYGIQGVQLILTGPDGNPVTDVDGNLVAPVRTDKDGKYSFDNLPVLAEGESYTVSIDQDFSAGVLDGMEPTKTGEGTRENDSETWTAKSEGLTKDGDRDPTLDFGFYKPSVSVGDYVWLDSDEDGVQDAGEPGIPGVVMVLTGPDGEPVKDVTGRTLGPVTTDANGKYTFSGLPVLADGQSYTVSIDREASAEALAGYVPTVDTGADRATNSSTWTASSQGLTQDGQRDATLDFGFVPVPQVSVGDFVWVDVDQDGIQDDGEPGIPGVVLKLTGPDGNPVTGVDGRPRGPVTTDANGKYSFDGLPVLEPGQSYTVTIDQEASAEALEPYKPTKTGSGTRENDSETWTAKSGDLTKNRDRDATLDFGFIPTPSIHIVKYDGRLPAPVGGPLSHANNQASPTVYAAGGNGMTGAQPVAMIITNNGTAPLANVNVTDATLSAPAMTGLTCDFSELGGPATGTTWAGPFEPGESFPCTGSVDLEAGQDHVDEAKVIADQAHPVTGAPIPGLPKVSDADRYYATTGYSPQIVITKRDLKTGNEADTKKTAMVFKQGQTRKIQMPATNTGSAPVHNVTVGDKTLKGDDITNLKCTFPDGSKAKANKKGVVKWKASFGPNPTTWKPGVTFYCTAKLKLAAGAPRHADRITLKGVGPKGEQLKSVNKFHAKVSKTKVAGQQAKKNKKKGVAGTPSTGARTMLPWF